MKPLISFLSCILVLLVSTGVWGWEFNEDDNSEGWIPSPSIADLAVADGKMIVSIAAERNDPYITGPFGPWDANDITGVVARVRCSAETALYSGGAGPAIYYFKPEHAAKGFLLPEPNEWGIVLIDMMDQDAWTGTINNIRMDFADMVPEDWTVEIDWIRLESLYLTNETFEWGGMLGWEHIGAGSIENFDDNEFENVHSPSYAVKATGVGDYAALTQPIKRGLELDAGYVVTLNGAVMIPADSWDATSSIWFRVREFNGTEERLSPPVEVTVFDEWFQFESALELAYAPEERVALEVQLYSMLPTGKVIYFDDIFVDVAEPTFDDADLYWPYIQTHWEFETVGDTEGWSNPDPNRISFFDVNDGALLLDAPAGTFDPYFFSPDGPYYAGKIGGIAARMKFAPTIETDLNKPEHAIYWFPVDGGFGSKGFTVPAADEWFVTYLDTGNLWSGWFNNFRIDLGHYEDWVLVDIDWVRFADHYILNNGFTDTLEPWVHQGAGDASAFVITSDQAASSPSALEIKGLGTGNYHAVAQQLDGWDKIPKGATITLTGVYYVPADSWDGNSEIWFRLKEYDGQVENLTPSLFEPVLDAWTPFEYSFQTIYEPEQRVTVEAQLFSRTLEGKSIYVDDVFVAVVAEEFIPETGWPVNAVKVAEGQQIVIDGQVTPEEYDGAQALTLNAETLNAEDPYVEGLVHAGITTDSSTPTSLDDFSATYYFMWDDEFFYAAVVAQDDSYSFVGPLPNGSDTLQFVFGQTPEEAATTSMYIPTIAPDDGTGNPLAKNDFGGWITKDIMNQATYAASVDPQTQDWVVEVKIPFSAMTGDFAADVFPPAPGDSVGFTVLGIDYDGGTLEWFGTNATSLPWQGNGLETMTFIERPAQ